MELFGNSILADEYKRLAEELDSESASLILGQLAGRVKMVDVERAALLLCKAHLPEGESADVMHAATSLQATAILITNDKDFDEIRRSGLIEVWSITEAIRRLL